MNPFNITLYCDGGARGNPGPAAIGIVIADSEKREAGKEYGKFIGNATNNEAEYQAVIFGLKKIKQLFGKKKAADSAVEVKADSELLVRQLNGKYKIKEKKLIPLFIEIWNLKQDFKNVGFIHIPREENYLADALVNKTLNGRLF